MTIEATAPEGAASVWIDGSVVRDGIVGLTEGLHVARVSAPKSVTQEFAFDASALPGGILRVMLDLLPLTGAEEHPTVGLVLKSEVAVPPAPDGGSAQPERR